MTHDYLVRSDDPCQTAGPVLDGEGGPYRLVRAGLRRPKPGVLSWGRRRELSAEMLLVYLAKHPRSPRRVERQRPASEQTHGARWHCRARCRGRGLLAGSAAGWRFEKGENQPRFYLPEQREVC